MDYPNARPDRWEPAPEDIEVGVTVVGAVRLRCLLDPDWGSVLCFRVAPGELAQYVGVVTGLETGTPGLYLTDAGRWRFPTPEKRSELRRTVIDLYGDWKASAPTR
ncbi:hypothetical protein [Glycomyces xiaoerkulensis]|uniref:hypothetical protein n=1 Tax=Glycomyces xiaoerkulensis TaxID=2038139 RepID=UPI000C261CE2|nr:hypothetical protein [Glycomyces xiaoerkulensis]